MYGPELPRQNYYYEHDTRSIPGYQMLESTIIIRDPVWGECEIGHEPGDEVFLALRDNDLVRRTIGIEQLTLSYDTATIPGTALFSRWEHIWGSVVFVRKMTEDMAIDPRDRLILQLRTFVSDLGHTAFSHLGDWMFQDTGTEDQHDKDLMDLLEKGGVSDILRAYAIKLEEVAFPEVTDWVECPSPDLCVDRVDYGAREMQRWLNTSSDMNRIFSPDAFTICEGKIVIQDERTARMFGKAFLLLATEHWGEPVHRLQLKLKEEAVKRVLVAEHSSIHPRDLMYTTDADITREMYMRDNYLQMVWPLMQAIGLHRRRVFAHERFRQLEGFLYENTDQYPKPTVHYGGIFATAQLCPPSISLFEGTSIEDIQTRVPDYLKNPHAVDFYLGPLKLRSVDPLFVGDNNQVQRLSEVDSNFKVLRQKQQQVSEQAYVARLHVNADTKKIIETGMAENKLAWSQAVQYPRMEAEQLRRTLHDGSMYTAMVLPAMINMDWCR
jgi:hypothetical protein